MTKSELKKLIKQTIMEERLPGMFGEPEDDIEIIRQKLINAEVVRVDKHRGAIILQLRDRVTKTIFDAKLI